VVAPAQTGKRIAVYRRGPAGLTAAYYLARLGHSVTVYVATRTTRGNDVCSVFMNTDCRAVSLTLEIHRIERGRVVRIVTGTQRRFTGCVAENRSMICLRGPRCHTGC
jgi:predicted NAD/FAD-binding protein